MKLLVPSRPKQSSEEPVSSRLSERIKKHHYESLGLLQFHTTIYKHIPIWILISKKVGMLSSGQTMAGKKKISDHLDRSLEERCCFPAYRKANTEPKVKRKEKLWSSELPWNTYEFLRMLGTQLHSAFSHEWSASFHNTQTTFCQTYHTWWLLGNWREITFERFHFPSSLCGKGLKIALGITDTWGSFFRDCKWLHCCNLGNLAPWFVV